ncbi:MAG: hypothetical protein ACOYD0_03525 [Candidatus Nanopelagicales bacterium]
MSPLLWWLPPLIATVVAIFWVSRKVRQEDARDRVELTERELERMRHALTKPMPASIDIADSPKATESSDGTGPNAPPADRAQRNV